jgi:pilus assembly protein Flp/PilA
MCGDAEVPVGCPARRMVHVVGLLVVRTVSELGRVRRREDGQAMVEYALLLFMIAIVSFVILGVLGTKVSTIFSQVVNDF